MRDMPITPDSVALMHRHAALLERVAVLERALENAAGEAYLAMLEDGPDPLVTCRTINGLCLGALHGETYDDKGDRQDGPTQRLRPLP